MDGHTGANASLFPRGSVMKAGEWLSISQPFVTICNSSKHSEKGIIKTLESSEFSAEDKYRVFCLFILAKDYLAH